eukprot:689633-Alexandrium_andersonii.AAC.1
MAHQHKQQQQQQPRCATRSPSSPWWCSCWSSATSFLRSTASAPRSRRFLSSALRTDRAPAVLR